MGQQVRCAEERFSERLDLDQRSDLMIGVVDEMMSIGEFSSRCGLSPKVLRSYAEAGVLDPAAVDPATGYRYYDAAQLEEADTVRLLRRAGVGLAEIARFLGAPTLDALDDWERSLTAETLSRREALAQVRCRLGPGPMRTRGATVIELRPVRDADELATAFDLLGAQLPQPIDSNDWRFDDLADRFPADQPIMVLAAADGDVVGGALAFREDNGAVALRIVGVVELFRHRGIGRRLVERVETGATASRRSHHGIGHRRGDWLLVPPRLHAALDTPVGIRPRSLRSRVGSSAERTTVRASVLALIVQPGSTALRGAR